MKIPKDIAKRSIDKTRRYKQELQAVFSALDDLDGLCDQVYDQIAALVVDDAIQREQQADKPDSE